MATADLLDLIEKKKHGGALSDEDIRRWIARLVADEVPEYQTASLLMAIRLQGMTFEETLALTRAMTDSGDRLTFPGYPVLADKHSTGGIGDKVTLILAPMLAAAGVPVTMLSGRALGFSGGTIDKFESLAGVSCLRSGEEMRDMLAHCGWANAQASKNIAPADRILYAMRDVTGTVDSIPLITASILSKKLAGGATHLCLDVKAGRGAFMPDLASARQLADNLQKIGEMGGMRVSGLVSRMDEPLGHTVGNYLELMESVNYLRQPPQTPLMELVFNLAEQMMLQCGLASKPGDARGKLEQTLADGGALQKLLAYLRFNGAKDQAVDELLSVSFESFPHVVVTAPRSGYIASIDGRRIGELGVALGAGRKRADDTIDPIAGFRLVRHLGERVEAGEDLVWVFGARASDEAIRKGVVSAYEIVEEPVENPQHILHRF